ncbi:MAG: hypothetical protein M3083_17995 [Actinomycetota bacterium]|nr:hypothetical protein [Actinomycetota bacterium]
MPTVVDDATLLAILSGRASAALAEEARAGQVLITGSWYYRLHRALHDPASSGSLSNMVANLAAPAKDALLIALDDLPPEIVVPGPRLLVPVMGTLSLRRRVNHLTAEALAAAMVSGAAIRVTTDAPLLRDACYELGIRLDLLPAFA